MPVDRVAPLTALQSSHLACQQDLQAELVGQTLADVSYVVAINGVLDAEVQPHEVREFPMRLPESDERLGKHQSCGDGRVVQVERVASELDERGCLFEDVGRGLVEQTLDGASSGRARRVHCKE
eukprot:7382499-Prymnesium_polylepis.4